MHSPILAPLVALVLWSFVMWAWLYATRIPAIVKIRQHDCFALPRSGRPAALLSCRKAEIKRIFMQAREASGKARVS